MDFEPITPIKVPALEYNPSNKVKPGDDWYGSGSGSNYGSGSGLGSGSKYGSGSGSGYGSGSNYGFSSKGSSSSKGGSKKKDDDQNGGRGKGKPDDELDAFLLSFGNSKPSSGSKGKGNGNKSDDYLPSVSKGNNGGQKELSMGSTGKSGNKKPAPFY